MKLVPFEKKHTPSSSSNETQPQQITIFTRNISFDEESKTYSAELQENSRYTFANEELEQVIDTSKRRRTGYTGFVVKGFDKNLNKPIAVKIMKDKEEDPTLGSTPQDYQNELNVLTGNNHTYISKVYDTIIIRTNNGDREGIVMEELDILPPQEESYDEVIKMVREVGSAIDYLHRNNKVHQDIKVSNIMKRKNGDYVLTDFGVTSYAFDEDLAKNEDRRQLARAAYMLISGKYLREDGNIDPILINKLYGIPIEIGRVLQMGMSQEIDEEFKTCEELANALEEALLYVNKKKLTRLRRSA